MTLSINQTVEGEIETIAFGGEGILRFQNFVIFIPFTAVGDYVLCKITQVKRSFAHGELIGFIKKNHEHTTPLCPYFGRCGGCQLQHLTPQSQLNYKLHAVLDSLKRIGHLSPPLISIVPAPQNWAYRRHITLHLKPKEKGFEAGYIARDHHSLLMVEACSIFIDSQALILKQIQEWVKEIPNPRKREGRLTLLKNEHQQFILFFQFDAQFKINRDWFDTLLRDSPDLAGIMIQTPNQDMVLGNPYCEEKIEGLTFRYSPKTFVQNHPGQSLNIYRHIYRLVDQSREHHILDLYCGFGITSLLLAKQGRAVTGMEFNREAIGFCQENAALNQLENIEFIQGDVEKILPKWLKKNQTGFIIANPPRQGLTKNVIEQLLQSNAESMIYVSCMPATLARDLHLLAEKYEISEGKIYDMFPQTAHVETLIHLKIRKNAMMI
ncbi:MAG: 23S rRNA (uracil(1939)-C(5))-methyltransferase RlmD [Parachlamydiaceae bacterium]